MALFKTTDELSRKVGIALQRRDWVLTTAESCSGGWIGKLITDTAGSSSWFECGFVTYSDKAKTQLLGVSSEMLAQYGAVSREVVLAMALGALDRSGANMVLAVSGIAGPEGGTADKPVGTVYFAWAETGGKFQVDRHLLTGDRESIRQQTAIMGLEGILMLLNNHF